jgi:LysR family glycine cleavage system transcriptional activator
MKYHLPLLNALRVFEAAARHGSFTKAADELRVTPGAVSQQIKTLEDYLGVKLFRRLNRAVELTDQAKACLPKLRQGFECLVDAVDGIRQAEANGIVTVTVPPAFAAKWLVPRLNRIAAELQDMELRLSASAGLLDFLRHDATANVADVSLRGNESDLTIRYGTGEYPGYCVEKLFSVSVTPLCSPRLLTKDHPLRLPEDLRYHTLLHDDTVYFDENQPDWAIWLKAAHVVDVNVMRGPRFSHAALSLDAAADGLGVVLGQPVLAAAEIAAGRLVVPFELTLPSKFAYYVVYAESRIDDPNVARFRAWLFEEVRRMTESAPLHPVV